MLRRIVANLHWKAFSLLVAIVLWLAVVAEPELVTSHSVPVFFKNLPRDLELGSDVPDRVQLEVRGPSGKLAPARLADAAVLVDLADINAPGERTFTVTDSSINLPNGVALIRAIPSQLRLRFDRLMSKTVPVTVRLGNQPPPGYAVVSHQVTPERLRLQGPEGRVQQIDSAQTDPIDLSSTVGRGEFRVHAYVSDPQVRLDGSPMVTVRVEVEKKP